MYILRSVSDGRGGPISSPLSSSKGSALHNYSQAQRSTQKWGKSPWSVVPPLFLSRRRGGGFTLLVLPLPQKSLEKETVERSRGLAHSPVIEDVEWEGAYLAKIGLSSVLLPALPQVPGALPCAPVATQLQHLQLLRPRPGPAQRPAPPRPPLRGRARPPASRAASGRACAPPGAYPAFPAARDAPLRATFGVVRGVAAFPRVASKAPGFSVREPRFFIVLLYFGLNSDPEFLQFDSVTTGRFDLGSTVGQSPTRFLVLSG